MSDELRIVMTAAAPAIAVAVVGLALAWLLRRLSVRWLVTLVAAVAVMSVVAAAIATAHAMFISQHDYSDVLWICAVAGGSRSCFALVAAEILVGGHGRCATGCAASGEWRLLRGHRRTGRVAPAVDGAGRHERPAARLPRPRGAPGGLAP
jgi:hypothetical protein